MLICIIYKFIRTICNAVTIHIIVLVGWEAMVVMIFACRRIAMATFTICATGVCLHGKYRREQ